MVKEIRDEERSSKVNLAEEKFELYNPSANDKADNIEEAAQPQELGDWLRDTEEHVIIL
jgi:hypothetical protein